ncbi:hypothetical protein HYX18_02335, partial [Candidatus Woesearchaeota archaeon]|nr:hypothetical protein [Candidatus Woesearchaeota archaeon]
GIDKIVPIRVNAPPQVTGEATKLQVVSNLLILFVVVILIVLAAILVWISKKKKNR